MAPALGGHDVHNDRARLPVAPAPSHGLVVLLVAMAREERHVRAVLPVEAPRADLRLGDQDADLALAEGMERLFLCLH